MRSTLTHAALVSEQVPHLRLGNLSSSTSKRDTHRNRSSDVRCALEQIGALVKTRQMQRQVHEEAAWLATHRAEFAGRWVALAGGTLLAVGDSARAVFQATVQAVDTPLIVRVDRESLPFAGW